MAFTSEQQRAYREKLKSDGICPHCHKRKAEAGRIVCNVCTKQMRDSSIEKFNAGLCKSCGGQLDNPSFKRCVNCSAKESRAGFWRRQAGNRY